VRTISCNVQGEIARADLSEELVTRLEQVLAELTRRVGFSPAPDLSIRIELLLEGTRFDRAFAHIGPIRRGNIGRS
jgi:hypothetical protein